MGRARILTTLILGQTLLLAETSEPADKAKPHPMAEASATVTVSAEAAEVEKAKTPAPVQIVTAETLRALGSRDAASLLRGLLPGQLLSAGGVGTAASLFLGGARNQDVAVMVDGLRFSDAAGFGGANLSSLGLADVDRVEIQQGPCSARLGAEAMGGAVAFYSAGSAPKGFSGELQGGLGNQNLRDGSFAPAYGWDGGWIRASVVARQENQPTETVNPYRSVNTHLGLGFNLGEKMLLMVNYRNGYQGVPIPYFKPDMRSESAPWAYREGREERLRLEILNASLKVVFAPTLSGDFNLGQVLQTRLEPSDPYHETDPMVYDHFEPYESKRNQAQGSLSWTPVSIFGLGLSTDLYSENAGVSDYSGGMDRGEGRHIGLALEPWLEPTLWLRLVGSVREQWDREGFTFKAGTSAVPEIRSSELTWKLGANLLLPAGFRAYLSLGKGFNVPFLYSVMWNQQNVVWHPEGVEALSPEQSRFIQTGLTWSAGPWSARLEASRTSFSNLVYFDLNSYLYRNGSNIRIQGIETGVAYHLDRWGLEGFYRNQEARDTSTDEAHRFSSAAVIRRPFQSFGFNAYWTRKPFRADLRWSWFGSRYENFGGYPGLIASDRSHFNDLSAALAWDARKDLSFTLRGQHLLQPKISREDWLMRTTEGENDASMIRGYPAQPPTWTVEARYRF